LGRPRRFGKLELKDREMVMKMVWRKEIYEGINNIRTPKIGEERERDYGEGNASVTKRW
jgi:hypothetical protein